MTRHVKLCDECRRTGSGGYHYDETTDPPTVTRCPSLTAARAHADALALTAAAHEQAFTAAKRIIEDAAHSLAEFSSNQIRAHFDDAEIPKTVIGAAFKACAAKGVIEPSGRRVPSTDEGTHGHGVILWRSCVYAGRRAG